MLYRAAMLLLICAPVWAKAQVPFDLWLPEPPCPIFDPCPCPCPVPPARVPAVTESRFGPTDDVVLRGNEVALQAIRAERTSPPLAARALAMLHSAMYDSVNGVTRAREPFIVRKPAPPGTSAEAAAAV